MTWQLGRESGPLGPYNDAVAVTPNDDADLPGGLCQALYVGGDAGNVEVVFANGNTRVVAVAAGWEHRAPLLVRRVKAASTTATGIVALYV